jgi:L-methionine (R)-S-oxide reductase
MATTDRRQADRYVRLAAQLSELFVKNHDPIARMATIVALLHHKMPHFFWTGFYRLQDDRLIVGPYQGPLACAVLDPPDGVCWAGIHREEPVLVPDVHAFPGHVACDSRSQSELVVPVRDQLGHVVAVLDVDSDRPDAFTRTDVDGLVRIVSFVYHEVGAAD